MLGDVSATDAGLYSVVVSGVCGNAVTNNASSTVNQNLVVGSAPVSLTNCPGTSARFGVSATGTGLTYQWYKGGGPLAGQTGSSLLLAHVSAGDAGIYSVVVSGVCGNAVTNSATLTVNQNVVVAGAPQSVTNCPGTSAQFEVTGTGTGLSYQWYHNGTMLVGENSSSLVLGSVSAGDAGIYSVARGALVVDNEKIAFVLYDKQIQKYDYIFQLKYPDVTDVRVFKKGIARRLVLKTANSFYTLDIVKGGVIDRTKTYEFAIFIADKSGKDSSEFSKELAKEKEGKEKQAQ